MPRVFKASALLQLLVVVTTIATTRAFVSRHVPFVAAPSTTHNVAVDTCLSMAKSRKARRMDKQEVTKGRPEAFFDAINDAEGKAKDKPPKKKKKGGATATVDGDDDDDDDSLDSRAGAAREARAQEARQRMEARPEVSTMLVDEDSGMEIVAQGKNVMDVVTRKAVRLSNLGPEYRLAQMFPGVPPDTRQAYRFDWKTVEVPEMVEQLCEACSVKLDDGSRGIPPHPSIANKAIDFVLANRDLMGFRMKRTLGRIALRSSAMGNEKESIENHKLWKNFLTLENHISAPFRQMIMDAEGRVGPNFGNLDIKSYCDGELYERAANYLVLKGMVAHWEKKVVDADYVEKTPQTKDNYISVISRGDPRRYLPDPPILFTLKECTQVCYMAQQMTKAFVETPELFDDLPPEIRFLEKALTIKGGTPLRKFVVDEFCPAEEITPEGLREGLRRLVAQLENMQVDPYADIVNILERLIKAMEVGTDDARDPYADYLANKDRDGPGRFQTYTFNHEKQSLVRFLDSQYEGSTDGGTIPQETGDNPFGRLFNFGKPEEPAAKPRSDPKEDNGYYKVPQARAMGRPHELGWLEELKKHTKDASMRLGKVPPGRIIPDDE